MDRMDPVCRKCKPPAGKLGRPGTLHDEAVVQGAVAPRTQARQGQQRQSVWHHAHLHSARAGTCGVPLHPHSICQPWSLRCPTRRRGSAKSWPPPCRGDGNCLGRNRLPDASTRNRLQHHIRTDERTEDRSASLALTADFHVLVGTMVFLDFAQELLLRTSLALAMIEVPVHLTLMRRLPISFWRAMRPECSRPECSRPACSRPVCSRPVRSRPEASTSMTFNIGHT